MNPIIILKIIAIVAWTIMCSILALADDEPVYDRYDVVGMNAVHERGMRMISYTNKDVPHVRREPVAERRRCEIVKPVAHISKAESQVLFSKCVRSIRKSKAYADLTRQQSLWSDDEMRMKKAIVWNEGMDLCNEQATAREKS